MVLLLRLLALHLCNLAVRVAASDSDTDVCFTNQCSDPQDIANEGSLLQAFAKARSKAQMLTEEVEKHRLWRAEHDRINHAMYEAKDTLDDFIEAQKDSSDACSARLMEAKRSLDGLLQDLKAVSDEASSHETILETETENLKVTHMSIEAVEIQYDEELDKCADEKKEAHKDVIQYKRELDELNQIAKPEVRYHKVGRLGIVEKNDQREGLPEEVNDDVKSVGKTEKVPAEVKNATRTMENTEKTETSPTELKDPLDVAIEKFNDALEKNNTTEKVTEEPNDPLDAAIEAQKVAIKAAKHESEVAHQNKEEAPKVAGNEPIEAPMSAPVADMPVDNHDESIIMNWSGKAEQPGQPIGPISGHPGDAPVLSPSLLQIDTFTQAKCLAFLKFQKRHHHRHHRKGKQDPKSEVEEDQLCDQQRKELQDAFTKAYVDVTDLLKAAKDRVEDMEDCYDAAKAKKSGEEVPLVAQRETATGRIQQSAAALAALEPVIHLVDDRADRLQEHIKEDLKPECKEAGEVSKTMQRVRDLIQNLERCPGHKDFTLQIPTEEDSDEEEASGIKLLSRAHAQHPVKHAKHHQHPKHTKAASKHHHGHHHRKRGIV